MELIAELPKLIFIFCIFICILVTNPWVGEMVFEAESNGNKLKAFGIGVVYLLGCIGGTIYMVQIIKHLI